MIKVNSKDNGVLIANFEHISHRVSVVKFEHVNADRIISLILPCFEMYDAVWNQILLHFEATDAAWNEFPLHLEIKIFLLQLSKFEIFDS